MKVSAVIVAAGSGNRLGLNRPKALVELGGRPMLYYSLRTLASLKLDEAIVAVPPGSEKEIRALAHSAALDIPLKLVPGGAERQDSVRAALRLVSAESDLVAVHDAARPFASALLFNRCLAGAERAGAAIVALAVADTLKQVDSGLVVTTRSRVGLYQAQTPQAFARGLILRAHERAERDNIHATDDADLVEQLGARVEIVEGSLLNFKITTAVDLELADALIKAGFSG